MSNTFDINWEGMLSPFASALSIAWAVGQRERRLKEQVVTEVTNDRQSSSLMFLLSSFSLNNDIVSRQRKCCSCTWWAIVTITESNNLQKKMWYDSTVKSIYHLNWEVCWRKTTVLRCKGVCLNPSAQIYKSSIWTNVIYLIIMTIMRQIRFISVRKP